jgi:hypothetical protein
MRKLIIAILAAAVVLATGCDAFRKMAGRPDSAELAARKAMIDSLEEAAHQARIDSLRLVEKAMADSLATLDSIKQMHGTILNPSSMGGLFTTKLDFRYYIVVGAFTQRSNAERLLGVVNDAGYVGTLISFRNGFNAIGICQTDSLTEEFANLKKVKEESFCPDDVWILVNE